MKHEHDRSEDLGGEHVHHDDRSDGMVPSQWFVRILAVAVALLSVAAVIGTFDEIKRYYRIKQM